LILTSLLLETVAGCLSAEYGQLILLIPFICLRDEWFDVSHRWVILWFGIRRECIEYVRWAIRRAFDSPRRQHVRYFVVDDSTVSLRP
jgi:hypothetical protein